MLARQEQGFIARVVLVIIRRGDVAAPPHGNGAHEARSLATQSAWPVFACEGGARPDSAVEPGLTSLLGERRMRTDGRTVRSGQRRSVSRLRWFR